MQERLDLVRLAPSRVLDAGAGTGRDLRALRARYPRADVIGVDASMAMLGEVRAARGLVERMLGRSPLAVQADLARLPLAGGSIDLAWSNLALHWVADPQEALRELARVVRPEGLVMFSAFGPDTLRELAGASQGAGGSAVRRFPDMHDLGDALGASGFVDPVMDAERITLAYANARAFFADLRATALSAGGTRPVRGLGGRSRVAAIGEALDRARVGDELVVTFEIVYGHAWRGVPRRTRDGRAVVRLDFARTGRNWNAENGRN